MSSHRVKEHNHIEIYNHKDNNTFRYFSTNTYVVGTQTPKTYVKIDG